MSLAWMGRRAVRNLLALGLLALASTGSASRNAALGFATAVAGIPVNRTVPALTGDQRLGGVLTCSRGTWDDPEGSATTFAFQWVRDNVDLTGRTDAQYTVTAADVGRSLRCNVRATGSHGSTRPPAPPSPRPPRARSRRRGVAATCGSGRRSPAPAARGTTRASRTTHLLRVAARRRGDRRPDRLHLRAHARRRRPQHQLPRQRRRARRARPPPASARPRRRSTRSPRSPATCGSAGRSAAPAATGTTRT